MGLANAMDLLDFSLLQGINLVSMGRACKEVWNLAADYHVHVVAHGEYQYSQEWLERYLAGARQRGIRAIGLVEHEEYRDRVDLHIIKSLSNPDLDVACGLEMDFMPGREEVIQAILTQYPLDFTIGSVHYIDGWPFDHPDYRQQFESADIDQVYDDYFRLVDQMVRSGLFDIVGHLDLIKLWGHRPVKNNLLQYVLPVLHSIKASGMVIEINSAGIRKPVGEIYPAPAIIEEMFRLGLPITMGSDAHHPDQVAEDFTDVAQVLWNIGYRKVLAFKKRESYSLPITL